MKIFNYEQSEITFQTGENVMINATEMAKPFGKQPAEWLRLPSTISFTATLSSMGLSHTSGNLIVTILGSPESGGGTWMHEDVAMEFARRLNPSFAYWFNRKIMELENGQAYR